MLAASRSRSRPTGGSTPTPSPSTGPGWHSWPILTALRAPRWPRIEWPNWPSSLPCPLVVDEAYGDFAETNCVALVREHPNVIVTRSFSKGYGLAGLRLGYLIARPEVVAGLIKVKDSYNCDTLSLVGGTASLEDQDYLALTRSRILETRRRLTEAVRAFGYHVAESQANFVWCEGGPPASEVYQALKDDWKILVRLMRYPGLPDGLRITVGTDAEIDRLLEALRTLI